MIRLFEQHNIRVQKELDGMWSLLVKDAEYSIPVPGCIEQHHKLLNYRGKFTLRRKVYIPRDTSIRFEFKGVSHTAEVYFDKAKVAEHYNAYTAFDAVIPDVKAGEHEIEVTVDNSFNEESALHIPNDYYTYGGITRPVVLEMISDVYIKNIHFTPKRNGEIWSGNIEITVENTGENAKCAEVRVELAGKTVCENIEISEKSIKKFSFEVNFENIVPWDIDDPRLYFITAQLCIDGKMTDDLIERVGFREIKAEKEKLFLNNKPIFLKGFNRHEDYGTIGCALPLQIMAQDIDLMREVGANAVRTSHYPNDERFLDICDEQGMLVWEENHARGLDVKQMSHPNFDVQCENCIREMIDAHYNHPSIIIWGILNECASESEIGREKYKRQFEQIKGMDISRPTTSATCRHFSDICLDLEDIVSFNIYSGWYTDDSVKEAHEKEKAWIEKSGGAQKPIIVSEFGAAAIYGYRDRGRCKWSEERQSDILREHIEVYSEDERISGIFIWQFADCKVTEENGWFGSRARCHNNKGVVDEYRRPKEAYYTVKELFGKIK